MGKKYLKLIVLAFALFLPFSTVADSTAQFTSQPQTVQAATMVYTTASGKYYYYNRHDKGLNAAKHVYKMSVAQAKAKGKVAHGTAPVHHYKKKVAKKKTVKYHKKKVTKKKVRLVKSSKKYRFKNKKSYNIAVSSLKKANYKGAHIVYVNRNAPRFTKAQLSHKRLYAKYNNRDRLGRATGAMAMLSKSEMPTAARQALTYTPSGWHSIKLYNGHYLYDRTHLIGYQFTGQNNNARNLITATSVLNRIQGMEKYENRVANYLRGNSARKVLYRVTPIYHGTNLVASGVHMEAQSIGSNAIKFNIYIFNVQDGLNINYRTGTAK